MAKKNVKKEHLKKEAVSKFEVGAGDCKTVSKQQKKRELARRDSEDVFERATKGKITKDGLEGFGWPAIQRWV